MNQEITALLLRDLQLEESEEDMLSEEELLQWLANQIAYLMEYRLEFLMSLMYRLDVSEVKVREAISCTQEKATNMILAELILNRQKERLFTKQHFKQPDIEGIDDCLKW